jgi:hypothetical protein
VYSVPHLYIEYVHKYVHRETTGYPLDYVWGRNIDELDPQFTFGLLK